jgi:hypothetical protein
MNGARGNIDRSYFENKQTNMATVTKNRTYGKIARFW